MSDFHQPGMITTLHRLPGGREPEFASDPLPFVLVIPAHGGEIGTGSFESMLGVLAETRDPARILLVMNAVDRAAAEALARRLRGFTRPANVLLPSRTKLSPLGTDRCEAGKGLNIWTGIVAASLLEPEAAVVCHDADIASYDATFLRRLAFPLADPRLACRFVKGYYPRVSAARLYGRVTRLFVGPLLRGLVRVLGHMPLLDFLEGFRYVLAGEYGFSGQTAVAFNAPTGWGAEIGLLAEAFRHLEPSQICQIDLGSNYEHKHQAVGGPGGGLVRMCEEITRTLLHELVREGALWSRSLGPAVVSAYRRHAMESVDRYERDAIYNRVAYPKASELELITAFAEALERACEAGPSGGKPLPPVGELDAATRGTDCRGGHGAVMPQGCAIRVRILREPWDPGITA